MVADAAICARSAPRELASQKELQRLAAEAEREKIARELEDLANAEPVTTADCLPVSRVRRLNRF
jgi:hypothetical protein